MKYSVIILIVQIFSNYCLESANICKGNSYLSGVDCTCNEGYWGNNPLAFDCMKCDKFTTTNKQDTHSNTGVNVTNLTACVLCQKGYYIQANNNVDGLSCTQCPVFTTTVKTGTGPVSECNICISGYYKVVVNGDTFRCKACPIGYTSDVGSSSPSQCICNSSTINSCTQKIKSTTLANLLALSSSLYFLFIVTLNI